MQIHIETGDWKTLQHPCERIRLMVFVAEQGVPKAEEIDDLDPVSTHFVAWDEHHMTLGCARMTPDGKIGRLAVLKTFSRARCRPCADGSGAQLCEEGGAADGPAECADACPHVLRSAWLQG